MASLFSESPIQITGLSLDPAGRLPPADDACIESAGLQTRGCIRGGYIPRGGLDRLFVGMQIG